MQIFKSMLGHFSTLSMKRKIFLLRLNPAIASTVDYTVVTFSSLFSILSYALTPVHDRSIFRTLSSIYDGAFLQKQLAT